MSLRAVGFQSVTVANELSREGLIGALRTFSREAEKADWVMVYYAGHGIEVGGVNYLIPVDAKLETDRDASFEAVSLEQVLTAVDAAKKIKLVVLDACRDNPFAAQMRRTAATRSIGRGLGRIEPEGATLVVYAAKHGQTALDGEGTNSPFAVCIGEADSDAGYRDQQDLPAGARRCDGCDRRPAGTVHLWLAARAGGFLLRREVMRATMSLAAGIASLPPSGISAVAISIRGIISVSC